uniref:Ribonuclease H-like domain-containing protein n=1 Tax=Tanacetum cinerariifolium TaxID=118510 RepID=A0A6L2LKZ8_TANCI|nr:ribonuclease H-like domain-containing protein [Tanacetum cinerariifolium]
MACLAMLPHRRNFFLDWLETATSPLRKAVITLIISSMVLGMLSFNLLIRSGLVMLCIKPKMRMHLRGPLTCMLSVLKRFMKAFVGSPSLCLMRWISKRSLIFPVSALVILIFREKGPLNTDWSPVMRFLASFLLLLGSPTDMHVLALLFSLACPRHGATFGPRASSSHWLGSFTSYSGEDTRVLFLEASPRRGTQDRFQAHFLGEFLERSCVWSHGCRQLVSTKPMRKGFRGMTCSQEWSLWSWRIGFVQNDTWADVHCFDVHNDGYFAHLPLRYVNGVILNMCVSRMPYEKFVEFVKEKCRNYFQGLYYQVPNIDLERGLVRVGNDRELSYVFDVEETFGRLNIYLDHLDMDLSEYLSQTIINEMDAYVSKIIGLLSIHKNQTMAKMQQRVLKLERVLLDKGKDATTGVEARISTTDKDKEKVSQDATKGVEARTSNVDSDYDCEFDSDDDTGYHSDKSVDYLSLEINEPNYENNMPTDNARGETFEEHDIYMNELSIRLKTTDEDGKTEDPFISVEKHVERYPMYDETIYWRLRKPNVGEKYVTVDQFKKCLTYYALANGFSLWYETSSEKKVVAKCEQRPLRLFVSESKQRKQNRYPSVSRDELSACPLRCYASPVVKPTTVRTVLSLALSQNWPMYQLDVKNSFLNGDLSETVYMYEPPEFDMTDLGTLNYFFGISATRDSTGMFMSQKKDLISDPTLYHSLEGGLQYLTFTCPYISYAMQRLYLHMHDPREPYLDFGLQLYASGDNLLSWSAKRKHTLSSSSAEAEYKGVANAVAETAWLRNLLRELHTPLLSTTLVYRDNVSAIYMTANPVQHYRTKHIEIDIHFVHDMVARGQYSCSSCTISLPVC